MVRDSEIRVPSPKVLSGNIFELKRSREVRRRTIPQVTVWKRCGYGAARVLSRLRNQFGRSSGKVFGTAIQFRRTLWSRKYPSTPNTGEFALKTFDLFGITVAASAGLCGAALAFSPDASAAPRPMGGGAACVGKFAPAPGGAACVDQMAGLAAPAAPVVLPGPPADGIPVPAAVPPVPAGVPVAGGPVLGAPPAAPVAAPLITQSGTGKGVPTNPALAADPVVMPGPAPAPPPPAPAAHPTSVTATGPLLWPESLSRVTPYRPFN